jgi:aspartokinase/homoserine dehydrogenase 1
MLFDSEGLQLLNAKESLSHSTFAMELSCYFETMMKLNLPNSILIDCTSSEAVTQHYATALAASISVVTPNKKANSASHEQYIHLKNLAKKSGAKFLYETNVGAGLPIINTLNDLLLSGDRILSIEGVLSGTLNYIFSSFNGEKSFSAIVKEAKEKGYTEPDPRDDLSGMDVARKILILARETGADLELSDIDIQNLVPENCKGAESVDEFFTNLEKHDKYFQSLMEQAYAKKEKLRYKAVAENNKAYVRLESVGENHPFYSLSGSDNIILITTERYRERPLVVRGPGAGAEVTAAGVFADVLRIGNYSN